MKPRGVDWTKVVFGRTLRDWARLSLGDLIRRFRYCILYTRARQNQDIWTGEKMSPELIALHDDPFGNRPEEFGNHRKGPRKCKK